MRHSTEHIEILEARITRLANQCASAVTALNEAQETVREANNHNVEVLNAATRNIRRLAECGENLEKRVMRLEALQADSIFGHGD